MNAPLSAHLAAPPTTIRRVGKAQRPASFERLRAQGITLLQKTSGATWTDHNLHDPGITILEALCYALTETAFRSEFPVEDLLTGTDGRIDFEALSLHPPHSALPCGATTAVDQVRRLLDRVDGLDDVRLSRAPGGPAGLLTMWLKLADGEPAVQAGRTRAALAAYRSERGLGEDIEPHAEPATHLDCVLHADIEIFGPHEGAEVLADVYHQAAAYVDGSARRRSRRELRAQGLSLDAIYDGPLVQRGFITAASGALDPQAKLYVGDLARHLKDSIPAIKDIHSLWLQTASGQVVTDSLAWRGPEGALCLRVPGRSNEQALHVKLRRRSQPISVDPDELRHRVRDLQAADRARRRLQQAALAQEEQADLPRGRHRPAGAYRSIQHDFPAIYGLGRHGAPPSAGPQRVARARQLRAYLMLFEQVIANSRAQTDHLAELFSGAVGRHKTYWWDHLNQLAPHVPGEPDSTVVPGAEDLMVGTPAHIESAVLAPMDRAATRRHHLLDHLLALHGEDFTQNAVRLYGGHLDASELDALLLDNKLAFLNDVVLLSRYRARGHDYSQPLWGSRHNPNFSGLARRVCLMLGFRHHHARALTATLTRNQLTLVGGALAVQALSAATAEAGDALQAQRPDSSSNDSNSNSNSNSSNSGSRTEADCRELLAAAGLRPGAPLSRRLLRAGAAHDGYRLVARGAGGATTLALHDAEASQWWALHTYASRAEAAAAAHALRAALLKLGDACEGLHLVEHLLLRPLCPAAGAAPSSPSALQRSGFFDLRLTALLPNWTVRTHQHGFQLLAEETLHINCPAHLDLAVRWLDFDAMCEFEAAYGLWQKARLNHCRPPDDAEFVAASAVDAAASSLIKHLLPTVFTEANAAAPSNPGYDGFEEDG